MKVNHLLKSMAAIALILLSATTMKATEITVSGANRSALEAALDLAQNDDVILLQQSIEIGEQQITIAKRVTISGVGEGIEIKPAAGYALRMLQIQPGDDATQKLVFENITFRDANNIGGTDGLGEKDGGLGRMANGTIEFNDCKFINNYSVDRGGVFDMYGGTATFTNCEFIGNSANGRGGAVLTRTDNTTAIFQNCKFVGNHANEGGVVYMQDATTQKFYNCVISENYTGKIVNLTDWTQNTGGGGSVFKGDGNGVFYMENSSVVKNYTLNDHGGILFVNSAPTITLVNTTIADNIMYRDANSMVFCTGALKLNLINVTFTNNNAYVAQSGDPAGKEGPNSGNTTGIRISDLNARVKICNSILAGNLSRDGGLVPVDLFLQENAANAANVATIFEIKNSIIGNIKGLVKTDLSGIPDIATSKYDFYPETTNWIESDISGIEWSKGLTNSSNGQTYYSLASTSKAIGLGEPTLLVSYVNPLVDQLGRTREGSKICAGAIEMLDNPGTGINTSSLKPEIIFNNRVSSTGVLNVDFGSVSGKAKGELYSINGQLVKMLFDDSAAGKVFYTMNGTAPGLYILKIAVNGKSIVGRLIVQ